MHQNTFDKYEKKMENAVANTTQFLQASEEHISRATRVLKEQVLRVISNTEQILKSSEDHIDKSKYLENNLQSDIMNLLNASQKLDSYADAVKTTPAQQMLNIEQTIEQAIEECTNRTHHRQRRKTVN